MFRFDAMYFPGVKKALKGRSLSARWLLCLSFSFLSIFIFRSYRKLNSKEVVVFRAPALNWLQLRVP